MRRLARRPSNAPELMPPERLIAQRAPMVDPAQLFQSVTVRPDPDAETRAQVAREGFKNPAALFGEQSLAKPGQPLPSPQQLDLLPGLPLPQTLLQPLPEPDDSPTGAPQPGGEREPAAQEEPHA